MTQPARKAPAGVSLPILGREARTRPTRAQTRVRRMLWRAGLVFLFSAPALLCTPMASAQTISAQGPNAVSPTTFLSEDSVTVSGIGFPANSTIVLWLDTNGNGQFDSGEPAFPLTVQTDGAGTFPAAGSAVCPPPQGQTQPVCSWKMSDVPAGGPSSPLGGLYIRAGICSEPAPGLCFGTTGVAKTQVTVNLGISHSRFGSGTTVVVTGYGFSASAIVNVWYDGNVNGTLAVGDTVATPSTDSNGAFSTSLLVSGSPGTYFIHASDSPATIPLDSIRVEIGTCWFQECLIDTATTSVDTVCLLGNSPTDLGSFFADCKAVEANYTDAPGGLDLTNNGPTFLGAGLLAAATAELLPPPAGTIAMTAAIANAGILYGNSGPDDASLLAIASLPTVGICPLCVGPLEQYIGALLLAGDTVPDASVVEAGVVAIEAAAAAAGPLGPALLATAQAALAQAAVAGSIACGYVNYFCNGSDITKTILENPNVQIQGIPITFLQSPFSNPPNPNPCPVAGLNCWGGLIGWAQVACTTVVPDYIVVNGQNVGACEQVPPETQANRLTGLAVPGSAGSPDNSGAPIMCATGTVLGLSIGYDGDVSFDVNGPGILPLVNYHNFQPGPGGTEPPNGIDVEIPLADRPTFMSTLALLRGPQQTPSGTGMDVHVCGRWVADMHMLWNELHPITSLSLVPQITYTGATSGDFNDAVQVQAQLTNGGTPVPNESLTFALGSGAGTETCTATTDGTGTAACQITPTEPAGPNTLNISFAGDASSNFGANTLVVGFTITHEETALAFTGASATNADFDDAATVQVQLTTDGAPLANESVMISLGSGASTETCITPVTGPTGFATCQITPNQQAGPYTITATFAGDPFYAPSSANAPFTTNKEETTTKFTMSSPTVIANGHPTTFSATLLEDSSIPIQGRTISISIGSQACPAGPTDATGTAHCTIVLNQILGPGTVTASFAGDPFYLPSSTSEPVIAFAFLASGSMVIGNLSGTTGNAVTFWGAQWAKINSLSGGPAPSALKGFADSAPQSCGGSWIANPPANSGVPPPSVPSYMGVIASSSIIQSGSIISGDVPAIVVIKTNPGYGPSPGQPGTGIVVATFCP
jgi:hypothetical protein